MGIGKRIGEECARHGLTIRQLSLKANIPYSTLYSAIKRDSDGMDFETVKKLAAVLGMSWYELYPGNKDSEEIKSFFGDLDKVVKSKDYKERLESASAYLIELQSDTEYNSGTDWTVEERNSWIRQKIPDTAKPFNVDTIELNNYVQWNFPKGEEWLSNIQDAIATFNYRNNGKIVFRYVEKICRAFTSMSVDGQEEAAKRVQELAQIPAYQRRADTAQTAPGGADDKEPAEK